MNRVATAVAGLLGRFTVPASLLACLLCLGMWARSDRVQDIVSLTWRSTPQLQPKDPGWPFPEWQTESRHVRVLSHRGRLHLEFSATAVSNGTPLFQPLQVTYRRGDLRLDNEFGGSRESQFAFGWEHLAPDEGPWPFHETNVAVPYWFPTALSSFLPGGWLWRRLRARRRRLDGLCLRCGYDRRAATSIRCPECGDPGSRTELAAAGSKERVVNST